MEFLRPQPGEGKASLRPGPALRLVLQPQEPGSPASFAPAEQVPAVAAARRAIALENHLARGGCTAADYELLSRAVAGSLQGGRAALLTPDRRKLLVAGAVRRGMRPFEAQLVVAAVQEAVRHGEADPVLTRHAPAEQGGRRQRQERDAVRAIVLVVIALLLACAMLVMLVHWTLDQAPPAATTRSLLNGASR